MVHDVPGFLNLLRDMSSYNPSNRICVVYASFGILYVFSFSSLCQSEDAHANSDRMHKMWSSLRELKLTEITAD